MYFESKLTNLYLCYVTNLLKLSILRVLIFWVDNSFGRGKPSN
jgi:hypothetical protein